MRYVVLLCGLLLTAFAAQPGAAQKPVLRWGGDAEGGAPFVEADAANPRIVRGFDVEIAEMIAAGLGRTPQFVQIAWASIEPSTERGDVVIGLSGIEDRPDLRARRSLTLPYFEFREVIAVRPEDRDRYRTLADLRGKRVGTLGATMAYDILLQESKRTGLVAVSYDDDVHPYSDLIAGRVDAVLLDHIIAERSLRRVGGFVIQPTAVATGYYVGILSRASAALRDSVDAVLRERMRDGALERTFRKWNVWDDAQAAYFARVLSTDDGATAAAAGDTARTGGGPTAVQPAQSPQANRSAGAMLSSIPTYFPALLRAALITLVLSCLAMMLAVAAGTGIAVGRVYGPRALRVVLTAYVEVIRGTPVLLQLFVLYYGLSAVVRLPAFLAAIIGLGLNYAAYESEIYRAALEAVSRSQLEAARTLGFTERQVLRLIRGPQALRTALAPMTNDFVALLKDSSLVSVITVVELTKQTSIYATNVGSWVVPGLLCAVMYLALSLPLSRYARRLERRWSVV